ncbi:DUF397 domain-containing protein [Streptomyces sp. NBC_00708]
MPSRAPFDTDGPTRSGDCVEVAGGVPGFMPVRDSKAPRGPVVAFTSVSWSAFVAGVKEASPSMDAVRI